MSILSVRLSEEEKAILERRAREEGVLNRGIGEKVDPREAYPHVR